MNVRKSNPLNHLYQLWVRLGGKAESKWDGAENIHYPDNLCHFMRVVLIWVWFRWLFKRRQMFTYIKGGLYLSPFIVGLTAFSLGAFTSLMVHYPEFRKAVIFTAVLLTGLMGVLYTMEKTKFGAYLIENQKKGMIRRYKFWAPKLEAFQLFKDWLYAKKMRVCPQIKVDL